MLRCKEQQGLEENLVSMILGFPKGNCLAEVLSHPDPDRINLVSR